MRINNAFKYVKKAVRPTFALYMKVRLIAIIAAIFSFTSCLKKDESIVLPLAGDASSQTLSLGANYSNQFYYNLKNQEVVHSGPVDSWDLSFDNTKNGFGVYLNGGVGMALVKTNKTNFEDITAQDCEGQVWQQDAPNGNANESAVGYWCENATSKNKIYIIRLDAENSKMRTLRLNNVTDEYYEFEIGEFGVSQTSPCKVYKDVTRVYSYYDLENKSLVTDVEPLKESWDIMFTRYGFTFYDQNPPLPYIVTGVLSNPQTRVFKDSTAEFYQLGPDLVQGSMSYDRDAIGYDWKTYDFDLGIFHVHQQYNYLIRTQNDELFKLRFLSFYDANGIKGTPTFEFKHIQ